MEAEFGHKYCLRESLSFALQLFPSSETLSMATKANKDYDSIVSFINLYRSSITTDVLNSGEYAFKAFLIQVANHKSKDALPIQFFFSFDKMTDEEKKKSRKNRCINQRKHIPVANDDKIKPGTVVEMVQRALGNKSIVKGKKRVDKFNMDTHTRCWKKYKIRPETGSSHPERTNTKYCVYDSMNKKLWLYTSVGYFLIEQMNKDEEYNSLFE